MTRVAREVHGRKALRPWRIISSYFNCFPKFPERKRIRKPWSRPPPVPRHTPPSAALWRPAEMVGEGSGCATAATAVVQADGGRPGDRFLRSAVTSPGRVSLLARLPDAVDVLEGSQENLPVGERGRRV